MSKLKSLFMEKAKTRKKGTPLPLPELDLTVYIKVMSGQSRSNLMLQMKKYMDKKGNMQETPEALDAFQEFLLTHCVCDEDGELMFDKEEVAELQQAEGMGNVLDEMFKECLELNGLSQNSVKGIEKN